MVTAVALIAIAAAPASAQAPSDVLGPYDGSVPFDCELQDAGTGTEFPDPDADPFCVEYDKTKQSITDLGIVEFLLSEPARVLAAVEKCQYFQRDHWTGSIRPGGPELWHWDGDYYFDIAKGTGGVSVRNLRVLGIPIDLMPLVPDELKPFFDPNGGGGVRIELETNPGLHC